MVQLVSKLTPITSTKIVYVTLLINKYGVDDVSIVSKKIT